MATTETMRGEWQQRCAVLTGAASGFGLELARRLAAQGARLVLVDVQPQALGAAAEELDAVARRHDGQALAECVDVADAAAMEALAARVQARFGAPSLVFNNAGVASGGLVWEHSLAEWQWLLGVNLWGVVHGVRVFTPMMLRAQAESESYRGHVVNTASMAGLVSMPNMGAYNVSKHAVVALSETLYQDLALVADRVHAHVLCPYFVPTGIARSARLGPDAQGTPTISQRLALESSERAVGRGKVSAGQVADQVLRALAERRFYIHSHPEALAAVHTRADDIVQARNPSDPYAARPELGQQLRAALRG